MRGGLIVLVLLIGLLFLRRVMMANGASHRRAGDAVMAGEMPYDASGRCARKATGLRAGRQSKAQR